MRFLAPAIALTGLLALPAAAQTVSGVTMTNSAGETATLFKVQPQARLSAPDYVRLTNEALNYRVAASTLASRRAQRADVKAFAKADLAAAKREQGALMAALDNKDRKIAKPNNSLSSRSAASVDLLRKSPRASFDNLYLAQMAEAAPTMWALQKGYATDGSDPVLRQVATISAPTVERSYQSSRGLMPAAMSTLR